MNSPANTGSRGAGFGPAARLCSAGLPGVPDLASSDAPDGPPNGSSAGMVDISATCELTIGTVVPRGCSERLVGGHVAPSSTVARSCAGAPTAVIRRSTQSSNSAPCTDATSLGRR